MRSLSSSRPHRRYLAGRQALLDEGRALAERLARAEAPAGMLLEGLGGSGKSALLQALAEGWSESGAASLLLELRPDKGLAASLLPPLRSLLLALDSNPAATMEAKPKALAALAGFRLAHLPDSAPDPGLPQPQAGLADSGDLEADLAALLEAAAEAGQEGGQALALCFDEVQALGPGELEALLRAPLALQRRGLPLALVLAGLPFIKSLGEDAQVLAGRLYESREIPPLDRGASAELLGAGGLAPRADAMEELLRQSRGLPAQLLAWAEAAAEAEGEALEPQALARLRPAAQALLDARVFGPRFQPLSPREKAYLRSMAHLGPGPHRSGDIADSMDAKITALGPLRSALLRKGLIFSPAYGLLAFAMPGFDDYLRRTMPHFR